jgi:hypothetical protein
MRLSPYQGEQAHQNEQGWATPKVAQAEVRQLLDSASVP